MVFMKCKEGQIVGVVIYGVIGEWNVVVDEILVKINEVDYGIMFDIFFYIFWIFGIKF